ncbi:MAG: CBS domain-containing protein [Deltaproteobacteria bacterium]|nr:CBS domain-containing protein [Deltaproteobacteria bacterium]
MPPKKLQICTSLLTCHINPDYDALASLVAAAKLYPEAAIMFPGGQGNIVNHPFVDSIFKRLTVVKPKDIDFTGVERLIVVDTRCADRLGVVGLVLENPGLEIHLYDHHPDNSKDLLGTQTLVQDVGANVTLLTELIIAKNLTLDPQEATMLALGLYEDTGNFTYSSTTTRDLRVATYLLEQGADLSLVRSLTHRELTVPQISLLNELIEGTEVMQFKEQTVGIAMASREKHIEDVSTLAPKMMKMLDLDTLFILVQLDNMVQLIGRSRPGGVNVGEIAKILQGGGHQGAAAATLKGLSLDEANKLLRDATSQIWGKLFSAGNLMVHPAITVPETVPLSEANIIMLRYGLHVLLAENQEKKVTGLITERSVLNAHSHRIKYYPVRDFMETDFETVYYDSSFWKVKEIIVDKGQRILPVVDPEGRALGVITRTDILELLASEAGRQESQEFRKIFNRNLNGVMEKHLPPRILQLIRRLGGLAEEFGSALYLVGGTVRDIIMRKPIRDLDFTLTGDLYSFIRQVYAEHPGSDLKIHPRFNTATLLFPDGIKMDFSMARVEYYKALGALPEVQPASIQLDLQRRDFTINSLAVSLETQSFGKLLDSYHGYQDIKNGLIKVLHSLSFLEDPTRAFRAVRFESRFGFKISRMTDRLIRVAVDGSFVKKLSLRRVLTEIRLTCLEEQPGKIFEKMGSYGLLEALSPDLKFTKKYLELFKNVDKVNEWFKLTFTTKGSPMWLVYFMALVHELPTETLNPLVENFDESKKMLRALISERQTLRKVIASDRNYSNVVSISPSEADNIFGNISWPGILYIMANLNNSSLARAGASFLTTYRRIKPVMVGDDLVDMGFKPGPDFHVALEAVRRARLDGIVKTVEEEKEYVRQFLKLTRSVDSLNQNSESQESNQERNKDMETKVDIDDLLLI